MRKILPVIAVSLLAACSPEMSFTPNYMSAAEVPEYPPFKGQVQVFYQYPAPDTFVEIGTVHAQGMLFDSKEGMIEEMQMLAAEMGANAIILSPSIHDGFFTTLFNRDRIANSDAIAIRLNPEISPLDSGRPPIQKIPPELLQEQ